MNDKNLRAALGYGKFCNEPRILVLDTNYLVVRDVVDGARDLGFEVTTCQMENRGAGKTDSLANLLKAILLHKPDFVLTINHLGLDAEGVLTQLLGRYDIPMASWFVDHPMPILGGLDENSQANMQVFCFERTALSWLESNGYEDPVYLPTGSNRRYFNPDKVDPTRRAELENPLSFAGNSWWTKARVEPPPWAREQAARLRTGGTVNRKALLNGFEHRLAEIRTGKKRDAYKIAQVALAEASMKTRMRFAAALKDTGINIFGDPYWSEMVPGLTVRPFVDYEQGLPALFAASKINANVTAEQMPTAVNQRVWDVPATGGFLLTDAQNDAIEYFEDEREIATYGSFEEARDKARFFLNHESLRTAIAKRGLSVVKRHHCMTHRIAELNRIMRKRFA